MKRRVSTTRVQGFNIRRRGGSFMMLWGFTGFVRQANGRWCSISPRNISTCGVSLGSLTCNFTTSDIRKNHKGGAECPAFARCSQEVPELRELATGHLAAYHVY